MTAEARDGIDANGNDGVTTGRHMSLSTRLILILAAVAAFVAAPGGRKAEAAGVRILSPAPGECVPGPDVTVHFELACVGTSPGRSEERRVG